MERERKVLVSPWGVCFGFINFFGGGYFIGCKTRLKKKS